MTEPVKRYGIHFAVEHMIKEDSTGEYVLASDYVRLEQECERLRLDAERYRLYRQGMENPEAFDAGVDAALSTKP